DAFQLVDEGVTVVYTLRGISDIVRADRTWIEKRYGVPPDRYVEYAALRGDKSDNLPGVTGVGEKTAAKLITTHRSLEDLYDHLDDLTPKLRDNLAASHEQVMLNRELMTLVRDVPIEGFGGTAAPSGFTLQDFDRDRVRAVFDALAFRLLWDRLSDLGGVDGSEAVDIDIEVSTFTTETDPGDLAPDGSLVLEGVWEDDALVGVVVAGDPAVFVPAERFDAIFAEGRDIVAHDAKPVVRALAEMGFEVSVAFDTAIAAYVVNPAQRTADLGELAYRELGLAVEVVGDGERGTAQGAFDFEGGPDLEAAARRAIAVQGLVDPLREQVEARGGADLLDAIELPLIPILANMEIAGIGVDREFLEDLGEDLRRRIADLEVAIHEAAGGPFNVNSTLQLREVLFERLELPVVKKTPKGAPSTDASVLEKLRPEHPVVEKLLIYRELEKLRSTYVDALGKLIEADGRVRGRFNQMGAATGRLSQEQPNLQNIPVRSEEGRAIRKAFVADPGHRFLVSLNHYDENRRWMSGRNQDIVLRGTGVWQGLDTVLTEFPRDARYVRFHARATTWTDSGEKVGLVWFDDISITDPATGRELVEGGDFERTKRTTPVVSPEELEVTFDFLAWDRAMAKAIDEYHFNSFRLGIPGIGGGTYHALTEPRLLGFGEDTPEYPILFDSYGRLLEAHLRGKGWLDEAFVYWFDEPSPDQYPFVMNGFAKLKRSCPGIARMLTEQVEP
ncbi:MAG: DNA polymerase, partial [Actinomycetota bacterium]|nr:DNA polymerase [Actinomycetota bacterium]